MSCAICLKPLVPRDREMPVTFAGVCVSMKWQPGLDAEEKMGRYHCPKCNGELSADAPEGLCPECLLRQAIEGAGASQTPDEERRSPSPTFVPPAPAKLAPHFPQLEI